MSVFGRTRARDRSRGHSALRPWTPATAANASSIYAWTQPSALGSDLHFSSGVVSYMTDRNGSAHVVGRTDGNTAGMPGWISKTGTVKRPATRWSGGQALSYCTSSALTAAAFTTTNWTFAIRCVPITSGGGVLGYNYPTNAGAGLTVAVGVNGVSFTDALGHTLTNTKTIVSGTEYAVTLTVTGSTTVSLTVQTVGTTDAVTVVGTIAGAAMAAGGAAWLGWDGNASVFSGDIGEALLFTTACSTSDLTSMLAYLCTPTRCALASAGKPIVLMFGNSLGVGQDAATDELTAVLTGVATSTIKQNNSVGGRTLAQMISGFATGEALTIPVPEVIGSPVVVIVEEGINGLATYGQASAGTAVANTEADYTTYLAAIRAISSGIRIISTTLVGRNGEGTSGFGGYVGGAYSTDYLLVNTWLRANLPSGCILADTGADASIGTVPPITGDTWRAVDGTNPNRAVVHRNATGQAIAATLIRAQLGFV